MACLLQCRLLQVLLKCHKDSAARNCTSSKSCISAIAIDVFANLPKYSQRDMLRVEVERRHGIAEVQGPVPVVEWDSTLWKPNLLRAPEPRALRKTVVGAVPWTIATRALIDIGELREPWHSAKRLGTRMLIAQILTWKNWWEIHSLLRWIFPMAKHSAAMSVLVWTELDCSYFLVWNLSSKCCQPRFL